MTHSSLQKPVGILGGTFDPVHHGHLRLALETAEQAGLDEVRMIPLHAPAHRRPPLASPEQRREMLALAIDGIERLVLDECELQRGGNSYTSDTLLELQRRFPDRPLCLILGMDAFRDLGAWHEWRSIPERAHLVVAARPGEDIRIRDPEVAALYERNTTRDPALLQAASTGCILSVSIPMLEISATRIRESIAAGRDPSFLLPPAVLDFIQAQQLYTMGPA